MLKVRVIQILMNFSPDPRLPQLPAEKMFKNKSSKETYRWRLSETDGHSD